MPAAGAVQVTLAGLSCLQDEGGSLPVASALWFARMSAFISALVVGLGLADIDGIVIALFACEPDPLRPAQVPRPAATRITAASAASQRGRRYQRGSRGRLDRGGAPAGCPGSPGPAVPNSRRCDVRAPHGCPVPETPAGDPAATLPGAIGSTGSAAYAWPATLLQEYLSGGAPGWLPAGAPVRGPAVAPP